MSIHVRGSDFSATRKIRTVLRRFSDNYTSVISQGRQAKEKSKKIESIIPVFYLLDTLQTAVSLAV